MIVQINDKLRILKDVVYREPLFIHKYYKWGFKKNAENILVFMADGRVAHGGLFDRLKGLMSVYALAKVQSKRFAINFTNPFKLEDYLQPNTYDWTLATEVLLDTYPAARPLVVYGEIHDVHRLLKERKGQIHYYYGYDILKQINEKYHTDFKWGELYRELFKPSEHLQKYIAMYKDEIGERYYSVHLRFLNLLGDAIETSNNPCLQEKDKNELINKCFNCLLELKQRHDSEGLRLMLASDSMVFLNEVKKRIPEAYIIPGEVKHIDTAGKTNDAQNLKVFVDLYVMSGAEKVYSIVSEGMWPSAFPEYSALISGKPFERIKI